MDVYHGQKVYVGICAMDKKSRSKAMKEILTRLEEFEYIKTVIFPESVILMVIFYLFGIQLRNVVSIAVNIVLLQSLFFYSHAAARFVWFFFISVS